jgi:uncharacterized membrane protein
LRLLIPQFLAYFLSFLFLAIYWNNHHHLFQVVRRVDGRVLWANVHLLFWLSLVPFVTAWTGQNGFVSIPVALYGVVLISAAMAYFLLVRSLLRLHPADLPLASPSGGISRASSPSRSTRWPSCSPSPAPLRPGHCTSWWR